MITSTSTLSSLGDTQFEFRHLAIQTTMDQAKWAHRIVSTTDPSSFDERTKAAWADCVELFDDTISKLNRSVSSTNPESFEDAQTWLSAAVANHLTCQNGFMELNSSSHFTSLHSMWGNFSKLLGNSLAINKAASVEVAATLSTKPGGGRRLLADKSFPTWVMAADRKLLQSSTVAADIVVAKDGSGNYKTISEAVAASVKLRSGTKRFVIHVKAGLYSENVEITRSMKNLMFIGDGIDSTIVTGSKNVQDGSTTFRSATFGKFVQILDTIFLIA
ncbi:hypothetical protein MRB53_029978 [Persea americana]|uniref:Uncharacterized protein n=1 Tax=Persea americana TaxID=3435 RepID=A0ACC2KKE4_PERAE|nr:hypothetical protein MRB53_029978 [Persea americana]